MSAYCKKLARQKVDSEYIMKMEKHKTGAEVTETFHIQMFVDGRKRKDHGKLLAEGEKLLATQLGLPKENNGLLDSENQGSAKKNGIMIRRNSDKFDEQFDKCYKQASNLAKQTPTDQIESKERKVFYSNFRNGKSQKPQIEIIRYTQLRRQLCLTDIDAPTGKSISHLKPEIEKYQVNELHISAARNNFNKVRKCINQKQISINSRDAGGNSALHYCARYNNFKMAAFLYECGAKVNAQNNHGQTALHYAFQAYGLETVKVLRNRGASTKICDINDVVPASMPRLRTKKNKPIPLLADLRSLRPPPQTL